MRYKLVGCIMVLLVKAPVYAQEPSLLTVETHRTTEPTVAKSGEIIIQTYTIEFFDLTNQGSEIIIEEDRLRPSSLGEFDVLDLTIDKQVVERETREGSFRINIWNLEYRLHIKSGEKGAKMIPPITINWYKKNIGQNISDPSVITNTNIHTDEVHVDYISTIPSEAPYIDIRDRIDFGNFENRSTNLRWLAWFLWTVPVLVWGYMATRYFRMSKPEKGKNISQDEDDYMPEIITTISIAKATRRLRRIANDSYWKIICKDKDLSREDTNRIKTELLLSLKTYLRTSIPQLNFGATPADIVEYIGKNLKDSATKTALMNLAVTTVAYQVYIEKGVISKESPKATIADINQIKHSLSQLRWYNLVFSKIESAIFKTVNWARFWKE